MLVRCIVLSLDRFEGQTEDMKGNERMNYSDYYLYMYSMTQPYKFYSSLSDRGAVGVPPVVLHGSSRE